MNIFFFKQKTAYEMRISDWSSDVCSSDLFRQLELERNRHQAAVRLKIRRQIKRQASFELFRLCRTNGAVQPIAAIADPAETRSRCRNARNIRNRLARTPVHRSACKSAKLDVLIDRSEEHTSELQSLMRISYAVFCSKKNNKHTVSEAACRRDNGRL